MLKRHILIVLLFIAIQLLSQSDASKGSVNLDSLNFEKIVTKFKAVLVKFDIQYPYGEKHDEYLKVAQQSANNRDLLICEIAIQDYGENENTDLAERYDVKKDNFPVLKLFVNGDLQNPISYNDQSFTSDSIASFIRKYSGLRLVLEMCIQYYDEIAEMFMANDGSGDNRLNLLKDAQKMRETLTNDEKISADIYLKIMHRIIERGPKFVESENERIKNIISGKVSDAKKKEMRGRINILQSFAVNESPKVEL